MSEFQRAGDEGMSERPHDWDAPCDNCGHWGTAHTPRRCIDSRSGAVCGCNAYRSYDRDAAYIGRLENQLREIGQHCLDLLGAGAVDKDALMPIWSRAAISVGPLIHADVATGQRLYAVEQNRDGE